MAGLFLAIGTEGLSKVLGPGQEARLLMPSVG